MSNNPKNIKAISAFFKKQSPKVHAFKDHPIYQLDEYIAGLYIDMLCVIAQYENKDSENQIYFISRIIAGTKLTDSVNDHIKNAMEITVEKVVEFMKLCKENNLTDIFIIDSLLISCADGAPNKKQTEFIAELADALSVNKSKIDILSKLAKTILEQNNESYHNVTSKLSDKETDVLLSITCYTKEFAFGVLINTNKLFLFYNSAEKPFEIPQDTLKEALSNIDQKDKVILENLSFGKPMSIKNVFSIEISNCKLSKIYFNNIINVVCKKVEFNSNYNDYVINVENSSSSNFEFTDCIFDLNSRTIEHAIIRENLNSVNIYNSVFKNIGGGELDGVIVRYSKHTTVKNCLFSNITGDYYSNCTLIDSCSDIDECDNEFVNCSNYIFTR